MKYLALLAIGIIAGSCTSCTLSLTPEGRPIASVDVIEAYSIGAKIIDEK